MRLEDPIDAYLNEVGRRPLLTREQEQSLARQVVESRAVYRRHILGSDGVLRQVVEALRRIIGEELPLDRTIEANGTRAEIVQRLPDQVKELEGVLEQNRADFALWLERPSQRLTSLIASRRKAIIPLVNQLPIQTPKLRPLMLKLEQAAARMTELTDHLQMIGDCEDAERLEQELYGYRMHLLEEPCDVRRRVKIASEAFAIYRQAKGELADGNLRLAVKFAQNYCGNGIPLADLIQEANAGLLHAIDKFDWTRGFKFSTYATYWIRQSIQCALENQSKLIREPVGQAKATRDLWGAFARLTQRMGREPTDEELAQDVELPEREVSRCLRRQSVASLNRASDDKGEWSTWSDTLEDEKADDPVQEAVRAGLREQLEASFRFLTYREREVLKLRFGLSGGYTYTLDEVGRIFKVTRERARQMEKRALEKMRQPAHCGTLKGFLEPVEA